MGISIEQYRFKIGNYLPKFKKVVDNKHSSNNLLNLPKTLVSLILVAALIVSQYEVYQSSSLGCSHSRYRPVYPISYSQVSSYHALSNFSARYLYGNRSNNKTNGIKNKVFGKYTFIISKTEGLPIYPSSWTKSTIPSPSEGYKSRKGLVEQSSPSSISRV